MIIQLKEEITPRRKEEIIAETNRLGYKSNEVHTQKGNYLVCIGSKEFDIRLVGCLEGVKDVHRVSDSFKLVSRKWKVVPTAIDLGDGVVIREGDFALMAGPCSIESEEQVRSVARHLAATRTGLTLDEMAAELGVGRRTAERMRDTLAAMFPQMDSRDDHGRIRRWLLPASAL